MTLFEFLKDFKEIPPTKMLRLPKKFVRLFGETLTDVAVLKPTLGLTWKIGLTKRDGKVWLNNGWPELVHHFGLDKGGRSIFFRYRGDSEFSVSIFDNRKSISQIYGKKPKIAGSGEAEGKKNARRGSSGNPIEISESYSFSWSDDEVLQPAPRRTSIPKGTSVASRCKGKAPASGSSDEDSIGSNSESVNIQKHCPHVRGGVEKTRERTKSLKTNKAEKKATLPRNFGHTKSGHPSFVVVMQATAVYTPFKMHLPIAFWREHLNCRTGDVVLIGSEVGLWIVKLGIRVDAGYRKPKLFDYDWKKFVADNNLSVGDSCTFELVGRTNISFRVTISRAAKPSSDCESDDSETLVTARRQVKPLQRTSYKEIKSEPAEFWKLESDDHASGQKSYKSRSAPSFFTVTVQKLPIYYVTIPSSFGSAHLEQKTHTIMLEVGERLWPVRTLVCGNRIFFSAGYLKFLKQNSVRRGDRCKFELKDGNKGVLKVSIFRCNDKL